MESCKSKISINPHIP